jgi:phosphorylase kinase gamma subunit
MFFRLCGSPPFWNRKQMYMLRDIMEGKYVFREDLWHDISETAKDLVRNVYQNCDDSVSKKMAKL